MSVIYLFAYLILFLVMDLMANVAKVCDIRDANRLLFNLLDIYILNGYHMNDNMQQTMQEKTYSLKDFSDYIEYEIRRQYSLKTSGSQQQSRNQNQQQQVQTPQQNQIRQQGQKQ